MEGWLSGRKHLTANEAVRNGTGVRISHLPQNSMRQLYKDRAKGRRVMTDDVKTC